MHLVVGCSVVSKQLVTTTVGQVVTYVTYKSPGYVYACQGPISVEKPKLFRESVLQKTDEQASDDPHTVIRKQIGARDTTTSNFLYAIPIMLYTFFSYSQVFRALDFLSP